MTYPNIDLTGPKRALQSFSNPPSASDAERATWTRDDAKLHRDQVNEHYLRTAFEVAAHLEMMVKELEEAFGMKIITVPTADEIRAEGIQKAAILDSHDPVPTSPTGRAESPVTCETCHEPLALTQEPGLDGFLKWRHMSDATAEARTNQGAPNA